jgi:tetratricopeptide (TPR) repeat protein
LPEKWPDPKGARRTSYDRICRHILLFLDATLKRQAAARQSLEKSVRGEGLDDGFKLRFEPAAPIRPTNGQIASYLKEHGLEKALELVRSSTNRPTARLAASASILIGDGDAAAALPALRFAIKEEPADASHQLWLGQALARTGDRAGALAAYRKAAELLPADKLVGDNREAYKYLIDRGLKDLGSSEPPPKKP